MSLARFLRSVAHTRPPQLFERVRRIARQRAHDLAPGLTVAACGGAVPPLASRPPRPVFGPRAERVSASRGGLHAHFLNVEHALDAPIDWALEGRPELERANLHYMEYLEALDDERFAEVVLDWIRGNPLGERGSWRSAWGSYALSLRTLVWMQQLAVRGAALPAEARESIPRSLAQQLRYLERRLELDLGGNHLVKNAKTLLWASRFFRGSVAQRWGVLAEQLLTAELTEQVLPDGMHFERSPSYHTQVFADLVECAAIAGDSLKAKLVEPLSRMAQVIVDLTHPDGQVSLFNDSGLHATYSSDECLRAWERVCAARRPEPRGVFELRDAGYYGARSGSNLLIADCGPIAPDHLPAHGHGDALSFEWSVGGQRIVVDAGVFEYERGANREQSRSTSQHNTLTLDNGDQAEFWASFRVGRRPRSRVERYERLGLGFVLEGSHDGYAHLAGRPIHRRRFIVGRESLVIEDEVAGGARQAVRSRLLLHPDVGVEPYGPSGVLLRCGAVAITLESRNPISVIPASWCPDFGVRRATRQLVIALPPAPCRGSLRMQRVPIEALERAPSVERWLAETFAKR